MKLVTVFTSNNPGEAQLTRSRLEAADFDVFLQNETTGALLPGYSTATSIRVQVPEDQAQDAGEFLKSDAPAVD